MNNYKTIIRKVMSEYVADLRDEIDVSQAQMAERLRITDRSYSNLEHVIYCPSAIALLSLFIMLNDRERNELLQTFNEKLTELEEQEGA